MRSNFKLRERSEKAPLLKGGWGKGVVGYKDYSHTPLGTRKPKKGGTRYLAWETAGYLDGKSKSGAV